MKMINLLSIICAYVCLMSSGCPDQEDECLTELFVQNNGDKAIFAFNCYDECTFTSETVYSAKAGCKECNTINPDKSKKIDCFTLSESTVADSLVLYLFLVDDLKNIEWDTILAQKIYTKQVFLTSDIVEPKLLVEYP